jgi:hypothetical protein
MTPIATVVALLLAIFSPGSSQREREPNDRPADATPLARTPKGQPDFLTRSYTDGLVERGRLVPGDVDYYSFAARAGDVVLVSLFEPGRGSFADPVLGVAGPGDTKPGAIDDDGGPGFLPRLAVPIDRTGVWTIAVTGFGDETFDGDDHEASYDYDLVVGVATNVPSQAERDAGAGNDTVRRAELRLPTPGRVVVVTGELAPGDVDHFLLPASFTVLTASLYDEAAGQFNDSHLRLLDRTGTKLLAVDDDSGPGFLSNLAFDRARATGAAVLAVTGFDPDPADDRGHRERFRYRLVVSQAPVSRAR